MASTGEPHGLFWDDDGGDRLYNANSMEYWLKKFFTSGVFNGDLQVRATSGMTLVVGSGYANVDGKVRFWNADFNVTLSPANSTYPRIDTVVITRDNVNRDIRCEVVTGAYSADAPQPTAPVRNSETYQLVLAQIYVGIGATSVSQSDITDTRVDSELCGYITGTVEELDFSAFTAQFERYFAEFKATHMANFSAWEIAQKAAYNSWFDLVKQQQIQDKASWDAWYADLQEELHELPPESAEYLQIQIDEIKESGLSGSILKISTINTELEGKTVTVTGNYHNEERTGTFDENLECEIIGIKSVGNVNISSTDGIRTAEATLNIPYYGNYNVPIAFWAAIINLQGDENLYGALVTIKDSNDETVGTVVLSAIDGTATFTATYADTYTFSVEYQGETISTSLVVDEETTYEVSLSAGFNYKTWCTEGGIDATQYSSLADVFDDELAVHRLMTVHASADYLIEAVSHDINTIDDFCANDTAMKWIGLRDYVCDGLTAITGVEAKFLASQYWERYLKDHVPVMTANNAPYGEVSGTNYFSADYYYKAFDKNLSTGWSSTSATNARIVYKFVNPTCVKKVEITPTIYNGYSRLKAFKVQGSNDGTTWEDLYTGEITSTTADIVAINIANSNYYLYYCVLGTTANQTNSGLGLAELQFYGRALNVSVPIMTSNTAPYGECKSSGSSGTNNQEFKAFDGIPTTYWVNSNVGGVSNAYLEYDFDTPIKLGGISVTSEDAYILYTFRIRGSNDGITWADVWDEDIATNFSSSGRQTFTLMQDSNVAYRKFRLVPLTTQGNNYVVIDMLQFYGLDYSEREFEEGTTKKWLYDHGLNLGNLEEYVVNPASGDGVTFESDYIGIHYTGISGGGRRTVAKTSMDLTNYNLAKAVIDDFGASSLILGVFASDSSTSSIAQVDLTKPFNYLDISSVDSNASVQVGRWVSANTGYGKVKELWVE